VTADLATMTDSDGTAGSDTISVNASDSLGNKASQSSVAVTVNGLPTLTAPASATLGIGEAGAIGGLSLSESGNTSGETFTVTLSDKHGDLSATGTGVSGSGTTSLTITGSLGQVNADLATLTDTDGTAGSDTITVNASDSLGNKASQKSIAVTVDALSEAAASASSVTTVDHSSSDALSSRGALTAFDAIHASGAGRLTTTNAAIDMIDIAALGFPDAHASLGFAFDRLRDTAAMSGTVNPSEKAAIALLRQYMAADFSVTTETAGAHLSMTPVHELTMSMPH
jgi:hypothetical protein